MVSSRLTDYRYRGSLARQAGNAPERRAPRGEAGTTTFEHRSTWPTSRKRNATAQAVKGNLGGFCVRNAQLTFVFGGSSPRSNSFLDAFQIDISGTVRGYVIDAEVHLLNFGTSCADGIVTGGLRGPDLNQRHQASFSSLMALRVPSPALDGAEAEGSYLTEYREKLVAILSRASPARSGRPLRDTTAPTRRGSFVAATSAAAAPVLAPNNPSGSFARDGCPSSQLTTSTSRTASSGMSETLARSASSSGVRRSNNSVAMPRAFNPPATALFRGLSRLEPLPCAKATSA